MKLVKVTKKDNVADDLSDGLWTLTHLDSSKRLLTYCGEYDLNHTERLVKEAIANGPKLLAMIKAQRQLLDK